MKLLKRDKSFDAPVKVVQFGEGNFLRAFIDWMIDELNKKASFNGSVQIIQPLAQGMGGLINAQDGLYTLIVRGIENGMTIEKTQLIESVRGCLNPYSDWDEAISTFLGKSLRFCFSNTTEAGIEYKAEEYKKGVVQDTFPAKVTALLFERFSAGLPGLIFIPCELIDKNGVKLRESMLRYAADWSLGDAFIAYIEKDNIFCNTLVDRIVAGYPHGEAESVCRNLGYEDKLLDCCEPFHFFVIEAPEQVEIELPFAKTGLNVVFVKDQSPYRTRKVRFLNGGHTASVLAAYLAGFDFVDEMVADKLFGTYLKRIFFDEIFLTVNLPEQEKSDFASAVLERFANPFAMHRLLSISLNSVSKWKVRVLPSLLDYRRIKGELPPLMTFSLAALIVFCENSNGTGVNRVNAYDVSDDKDKVEFFNKLWVEKSGDYLAIAGAVLERADFWEMDLRTVDGMTETIAKNLETIKTSGIRLAMGEIMK